MKAQKEGFWMCQKFKVYAYGIHNRLCDIRGKSKYIEWITCETDCDICTGLHMWNEICGKHNHEIEKILHNLRAIRSNDLTYSIAKHFWAKHSGDPKNLTYGIRHVQTCPKVAIRQDKSKLITGNISSVGAMTWTPSGMCIYKAKDG